MNSYTKKLELQVQLLNSNDLTAARSFMEDAMNAAADHSKRVGEIMGKAKLNGLIDDVFLSGVLDRFKLTTSDIEKSMNNISAVGLHAPACSTPISTGAGNLKTSAGETITISQKSEKRCFEGHADLDIEGIEIHADAEFSADEDDETATPLPMPAVMKKTKRGEK